MRNQTGKPRICIISAIAKNPAIGINNTLPCRLSEDLKYFKTLTLGRHILMGRKTRGSIDKPLQGRTTVIITHGDFPASEGVKIAHSLQEAIDVCGVGAKSAATGGATRSAALSTTLLPTTWNKMLSLPIFARIVAGCVSGGLLCRRRCAYP